MAFPYDSGGAYIFLDYLVILGQKVTFLHFSTFVLDANLQPAPVFATTRPDAAFHHHLGRPVKQLPPLSWVSVMTCKRV